MATISIPSKVLYQPGDVGRGPVSEVMRSRTLQPDFKGTPPAPPPQSPSSPPAQGSRLQKLGRWARKTVLPLVLLGSGLVSGYFTAGNPGRPFQSVQSSDWVANQPTPQSRHSRYGMGYFARGTEDNALYFLDMGTGQWNRVANFPQELPAQWFGVGASARITGEILPGEILPLKSQGTPRNQLDKEPYPRLTVKTIEPANRFMTARPAPSPSDPPFFEGTLQYIEARQAWLLVQKDTHQVFELSELEPQKIGQWFKSYQWARVRIENAPELPSLLSSPQTTPPPAPAINILTLEPL